MNLEALASEVSSRLAPEGKREELVALTGRIARNEGGSPHLEGDLLVMAGIVVNVCVLALETTRAVQSIGEGKRQDRIAELLAKVAEQTGDPQRAKDPEIVAIATNAIDVLRQAQDEGGA